MSFFNLNDITLVNLSQVAVTPAASNSSRSYGRRFTVTVGEETQEVVFKDLYSTARRLMKEARDSGIKDLNEVDAFVIKLEGAEKDAIAVYNGRGCWYKFRTWFHRLFGGAFRGCHMNRLATLHNRLTMPAQEHFSSFLLSQSSYFASLSQGFEVDVNGKKLQVEWDHINRLNIWDNATPTEVASCELSGNVVDYQNFEVIPVSCVAILYAVEQEVLTKKALEDRADIARRQDSMRKTAEFRDSFMDVLKSIHDLDPDHKVFTDPIVMNGKTYSFQIMNHPLSLSVQEEGDPRVLSLQKGASTYDGLQDGISDEYLSVLEEKKTEFAAVADRLEQSNRKANFIKLADLFNSNINHSGFIVTIENEHYEVWRWDNTLKIQEQSKQGTLEGLLEIEISRTSRYMNSYEVVFEGVKKDSIPEEIELVFNEVVNEVFKKSSSYLECSDQLYITILRESLDRIPTWHLHQLCSSKWSTFSVKYQGEAGNDYGGLKKEYIGNLASIISEQESLFAEIDGSLKIPRIKRDQEEAVLYCDKEEQEIYQDFGQLFYRCHVSKSITSGYPDRDLITTGRLFSDALFMASFSLSRVELINPMTQKIQIRMANIILTYLDKGAGTAKNVIKCLDLVERNNLDNSDDVLPFAFFMLPESVRALYEDDNFDPDLDKIKTNAVQFKKDLFEALMKDSTTVDELNGSSLGSMLDPIYQIARGMGGMGNGFPDWDRTRRGSLHAFSSKVQGSIDRDDIISRIMNESYSNRVIDQKIIWLKEWIKDASDQEIQSFLKFATGATSLAPTVQIRIDRFNGGTPFITASTCSITIHLSDKMTYQGTWGKAAWDDTKESFIRNLKSSISVEEFQNS